jgi:hypothetical protein
VQASEELSKLLVQMKAVLNGDGGPSARSPARRRCLHSPPLEADELTSMLVVAEYEPIPEAVAQLAQEVYASDLLHLLVLNIWRFEFEASRRSRSPDSTRPLLSTSPSVELTSLGG